MPAHRCVATDAIIQLLRDGIRLPSAGAGLLATDGEAAPISAVAPTADAVRQLAFDLAACGLPFLDLPACLGGGPPRATPGGGVKVDACRRCPIEPRCSGAPPALMAIPGIRAAIEPPAHWMAMPDHVRAVVLCTPAYDAVYGGTFVSLARWLARLGARVDIISPWGTIPEISASFAEAQPMGVPDAGSEVVKFMTEGAVDEYDLIVTPDPKVTHPLVVRLAARARMTSTPGQ
jgi:hypothetical protein